MYLGQLLQLHSLHFSLYSATETAIALYCQALCQFCVCLSNFKDGQRLKHQPPGNFFWCQMKVMAKIRLFYSSAMALILPQLEDIPPLFFMIVHKEAKILNL